MTSVERFFRLRGSQEEKKRGGEGEGCSKSSVCDSWGEGGGGIVEGRRGGGAEGRPIGSSDAIGGGVGGRG